MRLFKYKAINPGIILLYRLWVKLNHLLNELLFKKVRISGTVNLQIDEIKFKLYSNFDDGIVDALYFKEKKYSELNAVKLFKDLAKNSTVIFDIGANTGLYSITAKLSNAKASIYSFEPYVANIKRLKKNITLNNLEEKIDLISTAVGECNSIIQFAVPEKEQVCDTLSADAAFTNKFYKEWIQYKNINVEQISLDEFVIKNKINTVDLIKIDVENYELNVFRGALNVLKTNSPIIFTEIFIDQEKIDFYENNLLPLGYNCYLILEDGLVRIHSLRKYVGYTNFILSKKKSNYEFLSFSDVSSLINEIK